MKICLFVLTESTNVTDTHTHTHTHTQTLHDDIDRVCIASRGKNSNEKLDCDQTAQTSAKASNLIRR